MIGFIEVGMEVLAYANVSLLRKDTHLTLFVRVRS
jgi:hypothetical protein